MQKPLIPALFIFLVLAIGCGKTTDQPENADRWAISKFEIGQIDKDVTDSTALFTGYLFEFNADNKLTVIKPDGSTLEAKWADNISAGFEIAIENPQPPLHYIHGSWTIDAYTATQIKLNVAADFDPILSKGLRVEFTKQ